MADFEIGSRSMAFRANSQVFKRSDALVRRFRKFDFNNLPARGPIFIPFPSGGGMGSGAGGPRAGIFFPP
jgi:hypothetical protein